MMGMGYQNRMQRMLWRTLGDVACAWWLTW